ncbi:cytochrome d ubiquinol oxidase subunit II [Prolixibacteraceae bacterium JC049]|nr:cytochrome d ubiquinol oxidase subunit II [Prolixibacteraceae bacterium JC049]
MFETLSHLALQQYWWVIISLLAALLVFMMFVQGGQSLIYNLAKNDEDRDILLMSIGTKWEITFTTLVTFGGAFFASFPLFYSTSFGGAYWVWMAILFCFVIQAVSYSYRKSPANFLGQKTFDAFLFINGLGGTILIGTAVGTFFNGAMFSVNEMNFSKWETPYGGLEAVLNYHNVALGLAIFFLARIIALMYFRISIDDKVIFDRTKKHLAINVIPFLVFFLLFVIALMFKPGYAYDAQGFVKVEPYKYLHNLLELPVVTVVFLGGVVAVLWGIFTAYFKDSKKSIWVAGPGVVATVFALFLFTGLNNTSFYPSTFDAQSSLTIVNASSSKFTLTAMSYVSLFVPFVMAYIWYVWKQLSKTTIDRELAKNDYH